ncbi:MAG: hypothetical protein A2860_01175 [Candidatus Levybacteria bacterium RIFCSPHIGHO2_01_FULL_37_33]|uniref:GIY-YIG domain-containing protein n=3 Tax=Candidatus Zambryskiibacteriota TaxID=1817925 RepID=A0A1G2T5R6_9BACT|nr:MAG: hypothetical protein A2860_01175 [Candidatus Levybacteria bacterium RIFCSPHIGHO2_01_FULL_37_33]OHA92603.1 MAG: hypothetical protein A2W58_01850 [Candidatus Zambryskibacteria bacterium RIFCSPHIGHO2_02_38_10.5]OHA97738.1 MAG: hypothetical protein A3E32_00995 [Candidatus Zambryskibacteria bacterium RIFCSPHIGHO2_12_FULL_38_37]OHB08682.1 MAG: hypothetical protein A2W64_02130 [Candidatus Zambryskibacteria bacterium RIFCSPLOWO2_02_39_10]OHB13576.1 MAG: hypothetical protein A2Y49_03270 [Candida
MNPFGRAQLVYIPCILLYVLKDNEGNCYKGMTNNLIRRLHEHKNRQNISTSRMSNIEVVYIEKYDTFSEARKREVYLKTSAGRRFLKKKLST